MLPAPRPLLDALVVPDPSRDDERMALLLDMADAADEAAGCEGHSRRVAGLVYALLDHTEASAEEVEALVLAARLHDIGKLGMPLWLFEPSAAHNGAAREQLRGHVERGVDFASSVGLPTTVLDAIRHHHERVDGSGYPNGLSGDAIPYGARLIGLAEAVDALCSPRPGKPAWNLASVIASLISNAGQQWDRDLVGVLCSELLPALARADRRVAYLTLLTEEAAAS